MPEPRTREVQVECVNKRLTLWREESGPNAFMRTQTAALPSDRQLPPDRMVLRSLAQPRDKRRIGGLLHAWKPAQRLGQVNFIQACSAQARIGEVGPVQVALTQISSG